MVSLIFEIRETDPYTKHLICFDGAEQEPASGRNWIAAVIAGLAALAVYLFVR